MTRAMVSPHGLRAAREVDRPFRHLAVCEPTGVT